MTLRKVLAPILAGYLWPILAFVALLGASGVRAQTYVVPAGAGTQADPYRITELGNLAWLSRYVQIEGEGGGGKYYRLMNDIDASDTANWNDYGTTATFTGFPPIGVDFGPWDNPFLGTFDGQGHAIRGLTIDRRSRAVVGLFGCVDSGGSVTNLAVIGGSVSGRDWVGGLAGEIRGSITNCRSTAKVTARGSAGACGCLVGGGFRTGAVANCYATGSVTVDGGDSAGGLVGYCESTCTVTNCYATGSVTFPGGHAGGLVGDLVYNASITNCYARGAVVGGRYAGGLVGYNDNNGTIVIRSFWDKETSRQSGSEGGAGETTAQMKQQATFQGWDFTNVWRIQENVTYPYLAEPEQIPFTPVNVAPANGAIGVALEPVLTASAFIDDNILDTHAASQWQVRATSGATSWTLTAFDSGATAAALTSCTVPAGALDWLTNYEWRVRYEDSEGGWSAWSTPTAFQTRREPPAIPAAVAATKGSYPYGVCVTWTGSPGASDFEVWRSTHPTIATAAPLATWAPGTTYYDMTAELGVIYYYWVAAAADASGTDSTAFSASDRGWAGTPAFPSNYRGALWLVH